MYCWLILHDDEVCFAIEVRAIKGTEAVLCFAAARAAAC